MWLTLDRWRDLGLGALGIMLFLGAWQLIGAYQLAGLTWPPLTAVLAYLFNPSRQGAPFLTDDPPGDMTALFSLGPLQVFLIRDGRRWNDGTNRARGKLLITTRNCSEPPDCQRE